MKSEAGRDLEAAVFEGLYEEVLETLSRFGRNDALVSGDFYVLGDDWGHPQVLVNANLSMLRTDVVEAPRPLLMPRPGWEIVFALAEPGTETRWPQMGIRIRREEVLDGLQREYLPEPYRSFTCSDLRPQRPDDRRPIFPPRTGRAFGHAGCRRPERCCAEPRRDGPDGPAS